MRKQGGYINLDFGAIFAALIIFGIAVGVVLAYLVPWLLGLIKPLIHAATG